MSEQALPDPGFAPMPLPFAAVWLGDHLTRDYARFWSRLAMVNDPMQAAQAEGDLGVNLFRDWAVAMGELWLLPMKVWAASAAPVGKPEA
jgi:hypothetical protein